MVDIQTVSIAIASAGVLIAAVYYILYLRHQIKSRKTDVTIRLSEVWARSDFMAAWCKVMERNVEDYDNYSMSNSSKWVSDLQVATFFEGLGYLVTAGYADPEFVYDFFPIESAWEKLRFLVEKIREIRKETLFYTGFESLYNEVKKREQKLLQKGV